MTFSLSSNQCILLGLAIRLAFIGYAEIQDKYFNLKYTDIDYSVYTDGAKYVLDGGTPYDRHTYRYTPILAYMMTANHFLFESFGKILFSLVDIFTVLIMDRMIKITSKSTNDAQRSFLLNLWLLNPLTVQVSTRGNADTIVVFLVYITLFLLLKKKYTLAALAYGFVVHFKIYPIIYSLPIYFYIDQDKQYDKKNLFQRLITPNRLRFTLVSAGLFLGLLVFFHILYPNSFLYQTYFYHLIRKDNRHNFSPYFYFIYLYFTSMTPIQSLLAFLPQFMVIVTAGVRYYKDLPFCLLIQTMGFVAFNKVCTAQYFVWWIALLPLALVNSKYKQKRSEFILLGLVWLVIEIFWNVGAYLLEIKGVNSFTLIFISCMLFFLVNIYLMNALLVNHIPRKFMDLTYNAKLNK